MSVNTAQNHQNNRKDKQEWLIRESVASDWLVTLFYLSLPSEHTAPASRHLNHQTIDYVMKPLAIHRFSYAPRVYIGRF
ncbi:hypothetical protein [Halobacillus sp. H74]|uniref:hypothetical protein n=1 Tax=Halobacillus sp. H74 TaxID=3457436 RepID=UPI003FCCDDFD